MDNAALAKYIDLTLLKPEAKTSDITKLCDAAIRYGVYGVCVNSVRLTQVAALLSDTDIRPICVIGFPLGASLPQVLAFEAMAAHVHGAQEIDMVVDIGAIRDRRYMDVRRGIELVVEHAGSIPVKAIIESALLDDADVSLVTRFAAEAGVRFVKTSTGFHPSGGATLHAVKLMRDALKQFPKVGIKASGGIKTREQALVFIQAGATRIGASDAQAILAG